MLDLDFKPEESSMTDRKYSHPNSCSIGSNHSDFFDCLSPKQYEFLLSRTLEVEYQKGEVICKQGTFVAHVMVLHEGLIKTYIEGKKNNLVIQIFAPVNIIGLSSLYEGSPVLHHSTSAYIPSKLSMIDANAFKQLLKENPVFSSRMLSLLAEYSVVVNGRFYCLTNKQTYGRLADLLLCLSNRVYKNPKIPLHLSRKDIAELAGMTPESIARILTRLKADGLIELTCDSIEILNPDKLEMISQKG